MLQYQYNENLWRNMMSKFIEKLQSFLPVKVYDKNSEFDEDSFDILDASTDEEIGSYTLNEKGMLVGFSLMEEPNSGTLAKDEMVEVAQRFVDTFFPGKKEFELSGILDLDNPYMVTYEKRDEKYRLFLHSTGYVISISTAGQVMSFYSSDEEYEIRYSDIVVSKDEALKKYLEALDFEVNIQKFDQEVYKNGDNHYHLAYSVNEQIMDIPVDGSETTSIHEGHVLESEIPMHEATTQDVYELIGITSEYKLLDKRIEEGKRIEVWTTNGNVDEYTFDMDETDDHVVKLCFEEKTNRLIHVLSGEEYENTGEEIGFEVAKERAFEVMFKLFPDTHERFRLEVQYDVNDDIEDDMEEYDDDFDGEEFMDEDFAEEEFEEDKYIEQEDSYTFYFHLHHKGIRVDQHVSLLSIGKYTEKITHVNLDVPSQELYGSLPTKPTISVNEAKEIYKKHLELELMFIREYDEEGKSIYTLAYVPDFPDTIGHVRAIDTVSGKAMYVDVGDATFIK